MKGFVRYEGDEKPDSSDGSEDLKALDEWVRKAWQS